MSRVQTFKTSNTLNISAAILKALFGIITLAQSSKNVCAFWIVTRPTSCIASQVIEVSVLSKLCARKGFQTSIIWTAGLMRGRNSRL